MSIEIRYNKKSEYDAEIFIANSDERAYKKLVSQFNKLNKLYPNTYLPIYASESKGYVTLRLKSKYQKCMPAKLDKDAVYRISYEIRQGTGRKGLPYLNCIPLSVEWVSDRVESGVVLDL